MGKTYRLRKGREQKTDRTYALSKEGENKKEMVKAKTKLKKSGKKFLEILNSKPVIGAFIFIMLSLVSVFASDLIFESGDLSVPNTLVLTPQLDPTTSAEGGIFYNSSLQTLMIYNGTQWDELSGGGGGGVPEGAMFWFEGSCPSAYSVVTDADGRYIVTNSTGTQGAVVGTALTDQENRAVGQHSHSITDPGHIHTRKMQAVGAGGGSNYVDFQSGSPTANRPNNANTVGITIDNEGSVAGTNAPYIQYTLCKKTGQDSQESESFWGKVTGKLFVQDILLKVGIGTLNPTSKLDVNGSIKSSETFLFSDGSTQAIASTPSGFSWISGTSLFNQSFSVNNQESVPQNLFFKPDGTKMYVAGSGDRNVSEYDLSTPWDISTAVSIQAFKIESEQSFLTGLFFKSDGTKMYIIGGTGDRLTEYDLLISWNVSSAVFNQRIAVTDQDIDPKGIFFKPDGTRMYVLGGTGKDVNDYNLSTPWDISTAIFSQKFSVSAQNGAPQGIFFKPDGTRMYMTGSSGNDDEVNDYDLSTPWDISTAIFSQRFDVSNEDALPVGLFFKPDGTRMYLLGGINDRVYEYDLGLVILGKVGIGTTSPSKTLDVLGDVLFTGFLNVVGKIQAINLTLTGNPSGTPEKDTLYAKSLPKAWVNFDGTSCSGVSTGSCTNGNTVCTIRDSFNVECVDRTATGIYIIYWDRDFADTNYAVTSMGSASLTSTLLIAEVHAFPRTATAIKVTTRRASDQTDTNTEIVNLIAFGEQ